MKGHAKIELTNTKTGEVQILEEDNIVTNWLSDVNQTYFPDLADAFRFCRDMTLTAYDIEVKNRDHTPFTEYGGIIMFKERLEADPAKYYPEGKVTMTAHAGDNAYTGTDLTRGSFNANLSSYDVNAGTVTLVWDFNMEQGNGQISTVCLCNHVDGQIGYGADFPTESANIGRAPFYHHATNRAFNKCGFHFVLNFDPATPQESSGSSTNYIGFMPVYFDYVNSKLTFMCMQSCGTDLLFAVVDINASSVNPINRIIRNSASTYVWFYDNIEYYHIPISIVEKSITSGYSSYGEYNLMGHLSYLMMWSGLDYKGNFWFSQATRLYSRSGYSNSTTSNYQNYIHKWGAGTTMVFTKVNLKTMETTQYNVVNTTGSDITVNLCGDPSYETVVGTLCVVNDYMFIRGDDRKLYAINLTNNADVHVVTYEDGTPLLLYKYSYECNGTAYSYNGYTGRCGWLVDVLGDKMIVCDTARSQTNSDMANGVLYMVNTVDFICKPISATAVARPYPAPSIDNTTLSNTSGTYRALCVSDSPFRICTAVYGYGDPYTGSGIWTAEKKQLIYETYVNYYTYSPLGLITINTLSEPVTKTADMTMRITYTLTA